MNGNNSYIYFILMAVMIFMTIRNFRKIKQNGQDNEYVECYREVITRNDDSLDFTNAYLEKETNPILVNRTLVIKVADLLERGMDFEETLDKIDLECLFKDDKGFNQMLYDNTADVFLWIMLVMAKANKLNKTEVIEKLFHKLDSVSELDQFLEYQLTKTYYNVFTGNKDMSFVDTLLTGDYSIYTYNKKSIGLDKRFAEAIKAYVGEELDELSLNDIPGFAKTALGDYLLTDLGIYDKYAEKEETEEIITGSYLDGVSEEDKKEE